MEKLFPSTVHFNGWNDFEPVHKMTDRRILVTKPICYRYFFGCESRFVPVACAAFQKGVKNEQALCCYSYGFRF